MEGISLEHNGGLFLWRQGFQPQKKDRQRISVHPQSFNIIFH